MIPVLLFVILITFFLAHIAPGSPWDKEGRQLSDATIRDLNAKYGLDQPIWTQFGIYLWNVVHFYFGTSYPHPDQSVNQLILESWPYTLSLAAAPFLFIILVGIPLAVFPALRH